MPKERSINPVQAQRKAEKAKAIKKGKADVQAKRNERLATRNPEGIKRQIEDLKKITSSGGKLTRHEEQVLEGLEKEFKAVTKAREALGDRAPTFGGGGGRDRPDRPHREGGVLGKRRRGADASDNSSDSEDGVPEDVRSIPMPRDTPPPIPKDIMDKWWAKRRAKRGGGGNNHKHNNNDISNNRQAAAGRNSGGSNANAVPLTNDRGLGRTGDDDKNSSATTSSLPPRPKPVIESKAVYEAKPMVRDLRKEAVSAFVPSAVRQKLDKTKGEGGLLEPEEADALEAEGYLKSSFSGAAAPRTATETSEDAAQSGRTGPRKVMLEEVDDDDD